MEDRLIREAEHKEMLDQLNGNVTGLQQDLANLMAVHKATTKDYLDLRHELLQKEKALREECARLSAEILAAKRIIDKQKKEWDLREANLQKESEMFVNMFRNQALGSEEDLAIVKGQYEAAHQLYEKRIKHLEARLSTSTQKLKQCEERRRMEMEGYATDVKGCKNRLRDLERVISTMRVTDHEGVSSVNPKVVKLMAHNKDFTDIKTHLADIAHRLDKGMPQF